jgi:hypothetical protein
MFLGEIPGFSNIPLPVQGVLRVSAQDTVLSVIGLRGRYNERGDFLITTTPPTNEASPVSSSPLYFPHFADGGGYTTQFILFSTGNQAAFGAMRFFDQSGQSLNLSVR